MTETLITETSNRQIQQKSAVQVRLLKGPVYRAKHKDVWQWLERDQFIIREFFAQLSLSLILDDAEGYAFLRQQQQEAEPGDVEIPALMARRKLSFSQTLLLVLLRKRLAEHDSEESAPRLIVTRQEIYQMLHGFYPQVSNELKQQKEFSALISKTAEIGFLSPLTHHQDDFEVQRIIKAVMNAEQIAELTDMLQQQLNQTQEEQA